MTTAAEVKSRIENAFPDAQIEVRDTRGTSDYFEVLIVSEAFEGVSRVRRHKSVYALFQAELAGDIHALSLLTYTPAQFERLTTD